ncbi:MAG TPA: hypothetical protein VEA69_22950 [Tepidisphaeraceae bacterium]|nr:hypothetical protein [Tepidisphaeraceae bacterium]
MAMNRGQKRRALLWFKAKNGDRGCPVCGGSQWKVETDALVAGTAKDLIHVVMVTCRSCGLNLLFNTNIVFSDPTYEED